MISPRFEVSVCLDIICTCSVNFFFLQLCCNEDKSLTFLSKSELKITKFMLIFKANI